MKKQRYTVEIEMPDGDFISADWLKDLIQAYCDVQDEGRQKVTVQETSLPSNLDEAAEEALDDVDANWYIDERDDGCTEPGYNQKQMIIMFKAGAEWMAGQGWHEEAVIKGSDDVVWLNYNVELPIDLAKYFKVGDKVVVQIRKK